MNIAKFVIAAAVLSIVSWLVWNYYAGPLRYQRDMHAFADSLEGCDVFSETVFMYVSKVSQLHTIKGPANDRCAVRMETAGRHEIDCAFAMSDLPLIANGFRDLADSVNIFGGYAYRYDSSNPDPLTSALNSDVCDTKVP